MVVSSSKAGNKRQALEDISNQQRGRLTRAQVKKNCQAPIGEVICNNDSEGKASAERKPSPIVDLEALDKCSNEGADLKLYMSPVYLSGDETSSPHWRDEGSAPKSFKKRRVSNFKESPDSLSSLSEEDLDSVGTEIKEGSCVSLTTKLVMATRDPCVEYREEILHHLLEREVKFKPTDTMDRVQNDINQTMRSILIDWLVEVADEYNLTRQTFFLTVNYIDRLLTKVEVNKTKLQLVGISAMLVASKYEEIYPPSVDEFCYISDHAYRLVFSCLHNTVQLKCLPGLTTAATRCCGWRKCFSALFNFAARLLLLRSS
eukprot:1393351-Amorphochlora_amoeboformis.AAC.2